MSGLLTALPVRVTATVMAVPFVLLLSSLASAAAVEPAVADAVHAALELHDDGHPTVGDMRTQISTLALSRAARSLSRGPHLPERVRERVIEAEPYADGSLAGVAKRLDGPAVDVRLAFAVGVAGVVADE